MWFSRRQRDEGFFALLEQQGNQTLTGLEALCTFVADSSPEHGARVKEIEQEADEVRRIIIDRLNHTFITPIDREDIFSLSRAIDDVMDYACTTVYEMQIYKVSADHHLAAMVEILKRAGRELTLALNNLNNHPQVAMEHAKKAKKFENRMEKAYRLALAELFEGDDPVYMMKMREIYRHLNNAADRGDEAANIISDVIVKMT